MAAMADDEDARVRRVTDAHGHSWRTGTDAEVAWITAGTAPGMTITAAIPPVFGAYVTVGLPEGAEDTDRHNRAMLGLLAGYPASQSWWLGYLYTSSADMVCPGVPMAAMPKVTLYAGWDYVLVQAGPRQAATWRRRDTRGRWWHEVLPDLMFPADHSWLVSTLCDDDWTCAGGPATLMEQFLAHPDLRARRVQLGQDATPPGHHAS